MQNHNIKHATHLNVQGPEMQALQFQGYLVQSWPPGGLPHQGTAPPADSMPMLLAQPMTNINNKISTNVLFQPSHHVHVTKYKMFTTTLSITFNLDFSNTFGPYDCD